MKIAWTGIAGSQFYQEILRELKLWEVKGGGVVFLIEIIFMQKYVFLPFSATV